MTLKEFFRKARKFKWCVGGPYNVVRCANGDCPMQAVFGRWSPSQAALRGFPERYGWKIVNASDASHTDADRKWLLKNLGVSHTPTPEPPQ